MDKYLEVTRQGFMFYGRDNKKYYRLRSMIFQEVKTRTGGITVRKIY
jgi:hypothetical protein